MKRVLIVFGGVAGLCAALILIRVLELPSWFYATPSRLIGQGRPSMCGSD